MIRRLMCMIGLKPHVWEWQSFGHLSVELCVCDKTKLILNEKMSPVRYEVVEMCKYCHKIKEG